MNQKEHSYFHELMAIWERSVEPKFAKGAKEHRKKHNLWEISDEQLEAEIANEIKDLSVYLAEKIRRQKQNETQKDT